MNRHDNALEYYNAMQFHSALKQENIKSYLNNQ